MRGEAARSVGIETVVHDRGLKLKRSGDEWIGGCPKCGGKDRFAVNVRKQLWLCRRCAVGGDTIDLIQFLEDCDFRDAVAMLVGATRPAEASSRPARRPSRALERSDDDAGTRAALCTWSEASKIEGTIAFDYLTRSRAQGFRGLVIPHGLSGRVLRFHPRHWWRSDAGELIQVPALLALFRDVRCLVPVIAGAD
jgi:phage/plasmid primase-like uncharacterized protein